MTDPLVSDIEGYTSDPHVRLSMTLGALLEGGSLSGPWTPNMADRGGSYGPFQVNLGSHPGVTPAQANDPAWAVNFMGPEYAAAAAQVPASEWNTDPMTAAEQTAYHAERPLVDYFASHGPKTVASDYLAASAALAGAPAGAPAAGAAPATNAGFFNPLSGSSWERLAVNVVFLAAGFGLIAIGANRMSGGKLRQAATDTAKTAAIAGAAA